MRNSMLGCSFFFAAAMIGCGGDDDGGMITPMPDAKVFMDAGVDSAPLCGTMSAAQPLGLGTMQMPRAGDYIEVPTTGPQMGKTVFVLGAGLPGSTMTAIDALFIEVVKPGASWQPTNQAINFDTNAASTTYVAASYIIEDLNQGPPVSYARVLWASSGSVTFTSINDTQGALINGQAAATNFREINEMTGADVAGGCTASHAGLGFFLQHMNAMARSEFPSFSDGAIELTPESLGAIQTLIEDIKVKRAAQ